MSPTKYIFSTLCTLSLSILILLSSFVVAQKSIAGQHDNGDDMIEDGNGGFVLEELVVLRQANVEGVTIEDDGTFTLQSLDPSSMFLALGSGDGAAVNFELSFAKNSIVLTADGQQELENIARALKLIGKDASFKLIFHQFGKQDPKGRKSLTKNRANQVLNKLKNTYSIRSDIFLDYSLKPNLSNNKKAKSNALQYLGLTVVNMGENVMASSTAKIP